MLATRTVNESFAVFLLFFLFLSFLCSFLLFPSELFTSKLTAPLVWLFLDPRSFGACLRLGFRNVLDGRCLIFNGFQICINVVVVECLDVSLVSVCVCVCVGLFPFLVCHSMRNGQKFNSQRDWQFNSIGCGATYVPCLRRNNSVAKHVKHTHPLYLFFSTQHTTKSSRMLTFFRSS